MRFEESGHRPPAAGPGIRTRDRWPAAGKTASPLREVFLLFLRFGLTSFGGPLAHVAMFEEEVVRRRRWVTPERFLERMSITKLIPGPNSSELAMLLGYERAGWPGFFAGGLAFATPAVLMVAALGELYRHAGGFAPLERWVWGTKPVVGALIVVMIVLAARATMKPSWRLLPAAVGFAAYCFGFPMVTSLAVTAVLFLLPRKELRAAAAFAALGAIPFLPLSSGPVVTAPSVSAMFALMFYLGSIVIGSGYVLFSYFSTQLVEQLHWLNADTLMMGIVAGQLTPGPLFASATFYGQVLLGAPGAAAAAVGIFAPAFALAALVIPLSERLGKSVWWKDCLEVMAALCVALLAREAARMIPSFLDRPAAYAFFAVALAAHLRFRVNSSLLVVLGGLAGGFLR